MKLCVIIVIVVAVGMFGMNYALTCMDLKLAEEKLATAQVEMEALKQALKNAHTVNAALLDASKAQGALVSACLQREAEAQSDAAMREKIMGMGPPAPLPQEHKDEGVSDATRRAAADYFNRPL